ncbi:energy transducer TonB [Craterilacuibacter sp.]|uniref:energy transducer TonB n=1 Tax=Craterilacuibacter sp. TaxID=2870909 RepID=UPI003F383E05
MKDKGRLSWPGLSLSLLMHAGVLALVLLRFAPEPLPLTSAPLAVELWAGGGSGKGRGAQGAVAEPQTPPAVAAPEPVRPPAPVVPPAPPLAEAEVKLAASEKKPPPLKPPQKQEVKPEIKPVPKPAPSKPADAKPVAAEKVAKPAPPAKAKPGAKSGNAADDLLADLDGPTGSGRASVTQKGGPSGARDGVAQGSGPDSGAYLNKVRGRVRPYVMVPPGMSGNPEAVVRVSLLPTLEVRAVQLVKSSGNAAYDRAVQDAVWQTRSFPPLPAGARFADFREYTLKFRPHD